MDDEFKAIDSKMDNRYDWSMTDEVIDSEWESKCNL